MTEDPPHPAVQPVAPHPPPRAPDRTALIFLTPPLILWICWPQRPVTPLWEDISSQQGSFKNIPKHFICVRHFFRI